jgi:D-cysteine desulfhydrase
LHYFIFSFEARKYIIKPSNQMPEESNLANLIPSMLATRHALPFPAAKEQGLMIDVLRLDKIHPVVSGNKYFKLKYHVETALRAGSQGILSFGGAYSNHLVALACYCRDTGLTAVGVVRGESSASPSPTLLAAASYGMKLIYVSRTAYGNKDALQAQMSREFPGYLIVPEGGRSEYGVKGASEILNLVGSGDYDIITCAVGTGTMMAGILQNSSMSQRIVGFSSLRLRAGNDVEQFIRGQAPGRDFSISYHYHFGGYAKSTQQLIGFMNQVWTDYNLPTDFVYTAKMMFGLEDYVKKRAFPEGSRILAIHSGGLQGNSSIQHRLIF